MTPQQSVGPHSTKVNSDEGNIQEKEKKMKTTLQRRPSGQSVITKAFSKQRGHNRDGILTPTLRVGLVQNLVSQSSQFVMEERVQLSTGLQTQERHLFLFSDMLIITKSKTSSSLKLKVRVRLCEMWLASCMDEVAERKLTSNHSFVIGWPVTSYVVTFSSSEMKEKWLSALQWQISKSKEEEYPCTVSMKIVLMDIGKSAMVAVDVDNKDDAEKVIHIISQQLALPGRVADYRLWAVSGKEEAPYPLIGHELPYSIILHCLRETTGQASSAWSSLQTVDGRLHLDQLLREAPGPRFILRLKAAGAGRVHSSERHIKRKKSLINWALRRGHASLSGGLSASCTSPQKLFGHSLSSICHHGSLPRPIMDMLYLLYHEGATTTGIFRRSANAKTCRELKEKLNSGGSVQLEGKSVFVAAAVITDFLRNLPGSVLCSALYDQWMEAMVVEDKIERIQSLLKQLPTDNVTLLRYLFALLYHIQQHSQKNQMNAFNLALCIAPNMLWPPVPTGPEEESQSTRKVAALIQLVIENTPAIFGEDVESIFNEPMCGPVEDVMESCQQLYSLDDWDMERQEAHISSQRDSLLLPLRKLVLKEQNEMFDFMDEVDSLKRLHVSEGIAYSCGDIKVMSSSSSNSISSLMGTQSLSSARDRCSSEPSVCLGSPQPHRQLHNPVARQSSCDAAMMCGRHSHSHPTKGLKGDSSPRVVSGRSTVWRSPQVTSRFWPPAQRLVTSNRSSFSSLSSTANSLSGSSLSSIDSAFSFCSDSLSPCPNEANSLPFLFGSSARLRPLTPDSPNKFPKDWSMAVAQAPEDLEWYHEYDEGEEDRSVHDSEQQFHIYTQNSEQPQLLSQNVSVVKGGQQCNPNPGFQMAGSQRSGSEAQVQQNQHDKVLETPVSIGQSQKTYISHLQLKETDGADKREELTRTKITFYTASNTMLVKKHSDQLAGDCGGEHLQNVDQLSKTIKVHIPQTVFYGQNSPLLLQSVSTRQAGNASENGAKVKADLHRGNMDPSQLDGPNLPPQAPSKRHCKASSSISHTIRIKLPATVRNTVREYFGSNDSKSSADTKQWGKSSL